MVWNWIAGNWRKLSRPHARELGQTDQQGIGGRRGERERLIGLLQKHYGYRREQAEAEVDEFTRTVRSGAATKVESTLARPR